MDSGCCPSSSSARQRFIQVCQQHHDSPPPSATTSSHDEIKAQPSVDMRIHQTGSLALGDPSYHDLRLARIAGSHHCQPKRYCGVPRLEPECRLLGTANAGTTVSVVKPGGGDVSWLLARLLPPPCPYIHQYHRIRENGALLLLCCSRASVHTECTLPPALLPRHATASVTGLVRLADTTRQHAASSPRDRGM